MLHCFAKLALDEERLVGTLQKQCVKYSYDINGELEGEGSKSELSAARRQSNQATSEARVGQRASNANAAEINIEMQYI